MSDLAQRIAAESPDLDTALETATRVGFHGAAALGQTQREAVLTTRALRDTVAKAFEAKTASNGNSGVTVRPNPHSKRDDPGDNYDMSMPNADSNPDEDEGEEDNDTPDPSLGDGYNDATDTATDPDTLDKGQSFAPRGERAGSASAAEHAWASSSSAKKPTTPHLGRPGSTKYVAKGEDASSLYAMALELSKAS
jgi:hypothetical protein